MFLQAKQLGLAIYQRQVDELRKVRQNDKRLSWYVSSETGWSSVDLVQRAGK